MIEVFDEEQIKDVQLLFNTPVVNCAFLVAIVRVMKSQEKQSWVQKICCKVLGILAIHENNRLNMPECGCVEAMATALQNNLDNPDALSSILWGLVTTGRPLGGVEGEIFSQSTGSRSTLKAMRYQIVPLVFEISRTHQEHPDVLSKVFWLLVNLALVPDIKERMIEEEVIKNVLHCMKKWPDHEEMQYRACFALINVSAKVSAKSQLYAHDAVDLVLRAIVKFPSKRFQKCCVSAMRSIMVNDVIGLTDMFRNGGAHLHIQNAMDRFSDDPDLILCANKTLEALDML